MKEQNHQLVPTKLMNNILCPKCHGARTVFDPTSLLLTIGLPFALLAEYDNWPDDISVTKKKCPTCKGNGKLDLDKEIGLT